VGVVCALLGNGSSGWRVSWLAVLVLLLVICGRRCC
jgi:hypothetical protein